MAQIFLQIFLRDLLILRSTLPAVAHPVCLCAAQGRGRSSSSGSRAEQARGCASPTDPSLTALFGHLTRSCPSQEARAGDSPVGPGCSPLCLSVCLSVHLCLLNEDSRQCGSAHSGAVSDNGSRGAGTPDLPDLLMRGAQRRERNLQPIFFGEERAQTSPITMATQHYTFTHCKFLLMQLALG